MASLALYRKYRPRSFNDVIGQEHITEPLAQAIRNQRLHHAYLFSGPRGCGKTSSARILARSLNCANGPTPEPCEKCDSCLALAPDGSGSVDVIEIDAASHGGVDDARELRERAFFTPVAGRYKVYVIDEAHMVSSAGFNALLKLVEEPPDYVLFIFATTEPEKVLPTIRSRTHHYPFRLVPPGVLRPYLEQLCEAEGITAEPAVFPLVVRAGGGSVRDSLSVLDQLIAGAGPQGVTYRSAVQLLGVTDAALIDEMCDAFAAADGATVFRTVDRVVDAGHDPRRFAADLLERMRDLIVLNQVPDAAGTGLLDVPEDQLERMTAQALRLGSAELSRIADIVHEGLVQMRGTTAPRLVLEMICARALLPGADTSAAALQSRLERLERRFGIQDEAAEPGPPPAASSSPSPPAVPPRPPAAPPSDPGASPSGPAPSAGDPGASPSPPAAPPAASATPDRGASSAAVDTGSSAAGRTPAPEGPASTLDAAAVRRVWPEVLEHTKRRRVVWSMLQNVTPRAVEDDVLVLDLQHAGLLPRFSDDDVVTVIREALSAVLGVRWSIRCEVARGSAGQAAPAQPAPPPGSSSRPAERSQAPPSSAHPPDEEVDLDGPQTSARSTAPNQEEQAVALLRETFGAEPISDEGPRAG